MRLPWTKSGWRLLKLGLKGDFTGVLLSVEEFIQTKMLCLRTNPLKYLY